jgi:acetyl esterase
MAISSYLEPSVKSFLQFINSYPGAKLHELPVDQAREAFRHLQVSVEEPKPAVESEDRTIPVGPSGQVPIRVARPKGSAGPLPVVVYLHGGGWVIGEAEGYDRVIREIAVGTPAAVVFVEYTRAPEAKAPQLAQECYAAVKYIAENDTALRLDSSRLAEAGDSAGGNLSAVVAQLAKQRGGPKMALQVLINPAVDFLADDESLRSFGDEYFLTAPAMRWFGKLYLEGSGIGPADPMVSPARAPLEQLRGLPPAIILTAEFDPLRDQGEAYARRLLDAGVEVSAVRYLGTIHGFTALNALFHSAGSRAASAHVNDALRRAFAKPAFQATTAD